MPEYLAPGVFVEETGFRSKSIEGVTTHTTGFVGMTRRGLANNTPTLLTSFAEFERACGGLQDFAILPVVNYVAHSAMAFFNEGGKRLYVSRVVADSATAAATAELIPGKSCRFRANFAGDAGNGLVVLSLVVTPIARAAVSGLPNGSLVRINRRQPEYALKRGRSWRDASEPSRARRLSAVTAPMDLLTLGVTAIDKDGFATTHSGLAFDPRHPRFVGGVFSAAAARDGGAVAPWCSLEIGGDVTALDLLNLATPSPGLAVREFPVGSGPGATTGADAVPTLDDWKSAIARLEAIEDIAIVAAPGHTEFPATAAGVTVELVRHASATRAYRVAVLDVPRNSTVEAARTYKARVDSKYAALYYPWAVAAHPSPGVPGVREILLPPSGFVCGIYARVDLERGVHKAPANEMVRGAVRLERNVSELEQGTLNLAGVNCLRAFAGRGNLVWGARTTSSDPEWKYVNVRRYLSYLEHSIDRGTQCAVFELNAEVLWAAMRRTVEVFLSTEWRTGALLGDRTDKAFFVKCDRSTMTQDDLDQGRLICLVGVAVLKPAEFVIFRIGQWTADAQA